MAVYPCEYCNDAGTCKDKTCCSKYAQWLKGEEA